LNLSLKTNTGARDVCMLPLSASTHCPMANDPRPGMDTPLLFFNTLNKKSQKLSHAPRHLRASSAMR
jgi:hypothetical protein